jgi:hypothetical protein
MGTCPPPLKKRSVLEKQTTKRAVSSVPKRSRENDNPDQGDGKLPRRGPTFTPVQSRVKGSVGSESVRFGRPLRPVNHSESYDRVARWSASSYKSYAKLLSELARTKDQTYSDPRHQIKGLNGDARFARIKECLDGFENKPIELQMMMHFAAFSVEGPLIWQEEYFSNTKMILDREGWKARISMLFILTQRKMGKVLSCSSRLTLNWYRPTFWANTLSSMP